MANFGTVLFGPESEVFNNYAAVSPAPGVAGSGGPVAQLHVHPLGKQLILADGRKYRFAASGASTLTIGSMYCGPVNTASQQNLTAAAGAVNDRIATMTTGASSAQNVFAEGYLNVSVTPGAGQLYKIASHILMTSGAGDVVNFAPGVALRVATTTSSKYDLILNVYKGAVIAPATTLASPVIGCAVSAATTIRGCWLQTRGIASVLGSGTNIAGTRAVVGVGAGAVSPETAVAATSALEVTVGTTHFAAATTAWSTIFLTIDG